jgi:phosphoserine phosphatase RsbX
MAELRIGMAQQARQGENVCGDAFLVMSDRTHKLVGLVDGAGHGPEAAAVAQLFVSHVTGHAAQGLDEILAGAHRALASSRGVAATLLRIDEDGGRVEFAGVGNVNVVTQVASAFHPVPQPGILGRRCRQVRVLEFELTPGDVLVLVSDGVSSRLNLAAFLHLDVQAMARAVLETYAAQHDDASCLALQLA